MRLNSSSRSPSVPGPDGWTLHPEGAAVHSVERTAVIADVHLGYEWARAGGGDVVPAHSLAETVTKLSALLDRCAIERLIVAGDLVESPRLCLRTAADVRALTAWLTTRGVTLLLLPGNHDPQPPSTSPSRPTTTTWEVDGWTIGHGHEPIAAPRTISGHLHPSLRAGGVAAPCFLVGSRTIILPAFSPNAAGWNVVAGSLHPLRPFGPLRCLASAGAEVLDFGPVDTLAVRLAGGRRTR